MYDMHIHSCLSDGILNIQETMNTLSGEMQVMSFCDHEYIFDPQEYTLKNNVTKFVSGVEICCNIQGVAIEILAYDFETENENFIKLVRKIRNKRNNLLKDILDIENISGIKNLPFNIFRKDIRPYFIKKYGSYSHGWNKYNRDYVKICHSVPAKEVIDVILKAKGIPVLAHPMESFKGLDEHRIEELIIDLGIDKIEMVTPKHTLKDINFIRSIVDKYDFSASVGSDTHGQYLGNMNVHNIDLQDSKFKWIKNL